MQKNNWLKKLPYQGKIKKAKIPFKKEVEICITANIAAIIATAVLTFRLPPEIPLFYGLPEGKQQLVQSWVFIFPNSLALAIVLINSILANYAKDEYLKKVIVLSSFVATFFAIITVLKIFFLVGNI